MYKIAVIGDYDSIYGFAALGLDHLSRIGTRRKSAKQLHQLAGSELRRDLYDGGSRCGRSRKEMKQYQGQVLPAMILIPGVSGNTGQGIAGVKKSVEQAVGSDILFSNN